MVLQVLPNRRSLSILVGLTAAVVAAGCFAQSTNAAMIASDNAGNYTGSISTGSTGGTGFEAWVEGTSGNGSAGNYNDTSSKNIATGTKSWGTYANSYTGTGPVPRVDMTRPFETSLGGAGGKLDPGQTFSVAMQSDGVGGSGALGFSLQSSSPINQFTFEYDGSKSDNMYIIDGSHSGAEYASPVPLGFGNYIGHGMTVNFTLVTSTTYDLSVTPVGGSAVSVITNGTLPGGQINQADLFDSNTSNNGYFNSLSISAVPEPTSLGLMAIGGLALLLVGRRKTA
ncbi:MAG: PEP-CTERM sorting domain-containing protein [Phycisphaerae bacterium]|nr:PEP-CTERM sorting domain-containing protein [Phycisphaerae bacterium]